MSLNDFDPNELADAVENFLEQPETPEGWPGYIANDELAAWAMRKARERQKRIDEVRAVYEAERDALDEYLETETAKHKRDLEFFAHHLTAYGLVQREEGRKSVVLPAGKITTRATASKVNITDEDGFIEWAKQWNPDLVKVKETVNRAGLNKLIVGDKAVASSGEIIPGVEVSPGQINASIEVAK